MLELMNWGLGIVWFMSVLVAGIGAYHFGKSRADD